MGKFKEMLQKFKEMLPKIPLDMETWYKTWAPLCTAFLFFCASVLLIVESTHFPNSKCEMGGRVANHIKDECALYKQASKLNTTGILTYVAAGDPNYKLMIKADTNGSSVKVMQQDNTPTTGSGLYEEKTTLSALNVAMQAAFLGDTIATFDNKLTQIKSRYNKITEKCDHWESPNIATAFFVEIDLAEATNVIQAITLQFFIFSVILACHAYFTSNGDIPVGKGLNNTNMVPSLISAAILLGVMVATTAAYGAKQKDSFNHQRDWVTAVFVISFLWGIVLLAVIFIRFLFTTQYFQINVKPTWPGWVIYTAVYNVLSNLLHIWLACLFILISILISLNSMSKDCGKVNDIYDASRDMRNYVQSTMNNKPVTGWSSSSAALYTKSSAFEHSGSCSGLIETGATLFAFAILPMLVCICVVVYEQFSIHEPRESTVIKEVKNQITSVGKQPMGSVAEMHPLNADTLNF